MVSRLKLRYCKVIIATSIVWFLLDVFILMYYTDCTLLSTNCHDKTAQGEAGGGGQQYHPGVEIEHVITKKDVSTPKKRGIFNQLWQQGVDSLRSGPGEWGKAVNLPKNQQAKSKELFKINQFNLMVSDMISLNRTLPDHRLPGCKKKEYPDNLPSTSIVIVFHNEAWTTLLRTLHSIIFRSPKKLIAEVILVDDKSERDFLGKQLEEYVVKLPVPVIIKRMPERSGLIRARLTGAEDAVGDTITFLDAHCEATDDWLQPLMFEIQKNRKTVVCPIIDVISDDTFEYVPASDLTWGGFNWKLNFRWYPVPQRETERRGGDRTLPLRTPTMAGGLFSIDRAYFNVIGKYDPGMDIWGGENLEFSFRIWQCGGQLLITPCSRVGHVFRKTTPYSFPGGTGHIINHNNARLAEVWMDEWKEFYYSVNPAARQTNVGDLAERHNLRKSLGCKNFHWYLENVYPESLMPLDYYSLGEFRNKETNQCLDTFGRKGGDRLAITGCHGMGGNQMFAYTKKKEIMADDLCVDAASASGPVKMYKCHGMHGNQEWQYDQHSLQLRHTSTQTCLDKALPSNGQVPSVQSCDSDKSSQKWLLSGVRKKS